MQPRVIIHASHPGYAALLEPSLKSVGIGTTDTIGQSVAQLQTIRM